ncbi:DNA polymerase III, alpha subunit [Leptolyngbya sp. PCC 7375]|nr:DNA polymerase III, alpha subunit [Leptolyngbya sp. PCC 7375]
MVKVISRRSLEIHPVYDIGVAKDHNFLTLDGLVASNCFNKSHSMAYGYVTYQTAYLKANYPVEYMAALLTAISGDQDKVQMHIANCVSMGIEVLPPDVNRSGVDFTPENSCILFGLSAVRNVGLGAIETLIQSREEDGPFTSLPELCDRIDLRAVNRRALEALVHSGALDSLNNNRRQLNADLEFVVDWAQSRAKDREIGQGNIFDIMLSGGAADTANTANNNGNNATAYDAAPKAPPMEDYDPQERLRLEKELLGFYISDHPLKSVQRPARILAPISLAELGEQPEKLTLSAIVMISAMKPITTKKGDSMAILQIEDLSGQAEAVVFPRTYARIGMHIKTDARLMIWGKVDRRDDQVQLIVDDAEPIEDVRLVTVELPPSIAGDIVQQNRLRNVIQNQQGEDKSAAKIPVVAMITHQGHRQVVRLGAQFRVKDPDEAVLALNAADFKAKAAPLVSA